MRTLCCYHNWSSSLPFTQTTPKPPPAPPQLPPKSNIRWPHKLLLHALTGTLSINLLFLSPSPSIAQLISPPPLRPVENEYCKEEDILEQEKSQTAPPGLVTNQGIVEEAWEIVNESFLDSSDRPRFSSDNWLFSKMARYDMTGIGINLREIPDDKGDVKLKVLGLILDGPANAAGVRQGDEVISVNGVDVRGKSAVEVSSLLQGPNETFVTIEVKHGSCGPTQSMEVQRRLVARTPVFYRLEQIENGTVSVGYIRIKEFNALATKDLVTAIKRLQESGATYFLLDLRDNLGGLVQAGIEVAKLFLNEGDTVIYTAGRDPQYQKSIVAESAPAFTAPLIVLVNNKTASASEIVATALRDNCRAILVGERTYGKGLIQSVFELHE
ncbi:hypothetical protein MKW94_004073 [Papaver nudicaule]|uniref:C-terminal processing peptidase n=1 Tax=Papaver nudicaule TaxID=74823 RepID=A0AA41S3J8_PAPNU|nr:hypothetical protein [Papaver nudicaule]